MSDQQCINTIRCLAADIVQKSNSGHPGAPMGCAPMAHVLFSRFMRVHAHDWPNRDRFVLSNGHACALLYSLLHLLGEKFDVTMEDLKSFRALNSKTPGHPENHMTRGVEVTTGPLGQGFSNAVGLAIAESHLAAHFNKPDFTIVDHHTFVLVGDGCLQEGIASEAASLAGHLKLGKLIVLYDDNSITIDGETDVSFTEDVLKRFEAYGWHTDYVANGDSDLSGIEKAITNAKSVRDKPSIIKVKTTIGFGSVNQGKEKVHGAALGAEDIAQVKTQFGFNKDEHFHVPKDVYETYKKICQKGEKEAQQWDALLSNYAKQYPQLAEEWQRRTRRELPQNLRQLLPTYTPEDKAIATRKLSEMLLNKVADALPELIGGSADLTASNLTRWTSAVDYQADGSHLGNPSGRYIRFGVREHGMAAICNGLAAHGGLLPFGATFLNFLGYAQGAFRLSALSHLQVIYIMTHDSIGLGEDGPTHQPIEILPLMRSTPNVLVFRPADGNEVSGAYLAAFQNQSRPSVLCLSRQNLKQLPGSSIDNTLKGAYLLKSSPKAQVTLVATGSEVEIIHEAAEALQKQNIDANVVSMPSWELFEEQSMDYKSSVFPENIPVLSLEAQSTFGWDRYAHASIGMTSFGTSGPYKEVYKKFGITSENVTAKAQLLINAYKGKMVPNKIQKLW